MPTIAPQAACRSAAVTVALLAVGVASPAVAFAGGTPTLGTATIIAAGQRSPIDVGGNHLHQGDTIARGTQLVRWSVTMHGDRMATVTLTCPAAMLESGLGSQEGSQLTPVTSPGSRFYEPTLDVRFATAPHVNANTAVGHVYLLCRDPLVAPLKSGLEVPAKPIRKAGQRTPVAVPAGHLRRGAKIPAGSQLVRWGVAVFDAKEHVLTLTCPHGMVARGIGTQAGGQLATTLWTRFGRNALKVGFVRTSNAHYHEATASVYALCGR
jgi:hypothetical protein